MAYFSGERGLKMLIDVKSMVEEIKAEEKAKGLKRELLILQVGDNPASNVYIKGKKKDCEELGYACTVVKADGTRPGKHLERTVNYSEADGIILQEPCGLGEETRRRILKKIRRWQDVDGFLPDSQHTPCTPLGIMNIIEKFCGSKDLSGKIVAVIGRGELVGKPMMKLLIENGATAISCNSRTPNLAKIAGQADIIISATGQKGLITKSHLKKGAIVIDAGIFVDEDGKLHGDCDRALYDDPDVWVTPVPGGVGLMTRMALMQNLGNVHGSHAWEDSEELSF